MDLVKCRQCYGYVTPSAKTCMNCGTTSPASGGGGSFAVIGFLIVMLGIPVAIGVLVLVFWGAPPKANGVKSIDYVVAMFSERAARLREHMSSPAPAPVTLERWPSSRPRWRCDQFATADARVECLIEDETNNPSTDPLAAKRTPSEWRALAAADPCAGYSAPIKEMDCREALLRGGDASQ